VPCSLIFSCWRSRASSSSICCTSVGRTTAPRRHAHLGIGLCLFAQPDRQLLGGADELDVGLCRLAEQEGHGVGVRVEWRGAANLEQRGNSWECSCRLAAATAVATTCSVWQHNKDRGVCYAALRCRGCPVGRLCSLHGSAVAPTLVRHPLIWKSTTRRPWSQV
jgi:hypothetical protein